VDVHPGGDEYLTTPDIDAGPPTSWCGIGSSTISRSTRWPYRTDELILAGATGPDQAVHVVVQRQPLWLLGSIAYPGGDPPGWLRCSRGGVG
jgi:hypothetical protein